MTQFDYLICRNFEFTFVLLKTHFSELKFGAQIDITQLTHHPSPEDEGRRGLPMRPLSLSKNSSQIVKERKPETN